MPNEIRLTTKERDLLTQVADGATNSEIAAKNGVSPETIKSELKRIFRKIGVDNRTKAAVMFATGKLG